MSKNKPKYNEIIFSEEQELLIIDMYSKQKISTVKIGKLFNVSHKIIAKVLDKNNIERTGVGKRKYNLNEHYFDKIDTPNKAYILGLLYADGYNSLDKGTIRIQLQESDKKILELIKTELGSDKPLKYIKCNDKIASNGFVSKDMYQLEFYSMHMCKILEQWGMVQNKSLILEFPEFLNSSLYSHFIRGYYDGDGSYCHRITKEYGVRDLVTITSTESFCKTAKRIINTFTSILGGGIYDASCHNGTTKVLSISGANQCKKFLDWIYKDAELYIQRKYDNYIKNIGLSYK